MESDYLQKLFISEAKPALQRHSGGGDTQAAYQNGVAAGIEKGKKAQYDEFWDNYQDYGNRDDYERAFCGIGWDERTFNPKHLIKPINANAMFSRSPIINLKKLISDLNIKLDLTGITYGRASQIFWHSTITDVGAIGFTHISNESSGVSYLLYDATRLVNVEKIILPDSGGVALASNCFSGCINLEEIRFEGTIGQNGLNVQWSTKLSHDSLMSIINALKDNSGTENWNEIVLGSDNIAKLTEEELDIMVTKQWIYS